MTARRAPGPLVSAPRTLAAVRAESAGELRAALAKCDASRAQIAAELDCSDSRLSVFVDEGQSATIDIARAALLPLPARIALAEWIAGPGYHVVATPEASDASDLAASARIMRAAAELAAEHLDAVRDGHVTAREGAVLVDAADSVARLALGVMELGRCAMREGVIGVARLRSVPPAAKRSA